MSEIIPFSIALLLDHLLRKVTFLRFCFSVHPVYFIVFEEESVVVHACSLVFYSKLFPLDKFLLESASVMRKLQHVIKRDSFTY
jgi:hypothetical protein